MPSDRPFIIINRLGMVGATPDPAEAEFIASEGGRRPYEWLAGGLDPVGSENPPITPERALWLSQVEPVLDPDEVLSMSPERAFQILSKGWEEYMRQSKRGHTRLSWRGFTEPLDGILGENTKLHKIDPRSDKQAVALGLSLLPEASTFVGSSRAMLNMNPPEYFRRYVPKTSSRQGKRVPGWEGPYRTPEVKATFCAGASAECKAACLVLSGNNRSDARNNLTKLTRSKWVLNHPVAFLRLLVGAMDKYSKSRMKILGAKRAEKFVRLNVYSDLPWELIAPWMFDIGWMEDRYGTELGTRLSYYDYTKVPGRRTIEGPPDRPPVYDLSFSYSGHNERDCTQALKSGMRVTMVFVDPGRYKEQKQFTKALARKWAAAGKAPNSEYPKWPDALREKMETEAKFEYHREVPLPKTIRSPDLWGGKRLQVIDGDWSDIRPFDPPCVVVGLRYKLPLGFGGFEGAPKNFVVRGKVVSSDSGTYFALPEVPTSLPEVQDPEAVKMPKAATWHPNPVRADARGGW